MPRSDIFRPNFQPLPYWWEAYAPSAGEIAEVPREARVAIGNGPWCITFEWENGRALRVDLEQYH
jgi:hypothetical protein